MPSATNNLDAAFPALTKALQKENARAAEEAGIKIPSSTIPKKSDTLMLALRKNGTIANVYLKTMTTTIVSMKKIATDHLEFVRGNELQKLEDQKEFLALLKDLVGKNAFSSPKGSNQRNNVTDLTKPTFWDKVFERGLIPALVAALPMVLKGLLMGGGAAAAGIAGLAFGFIEGLLASAGAIYRKIVPVKIQKIITRIIEGVGNIFSKLKGGFLRLLEFFGIGSKELGAIGKLFKPILEHIGGLFKFMVPFFKFGRAIGKLLGKLAIPLQVVLSIWDSITGFIDGFEKDQGDLGSKIISGIGAGLVNLVDGLIGWLVDGISWLGGWVLEKFGFEKAGKALKDFSFKDFISKLIQAPIDFYKDQWKFIKGIFLDETKTIPEKIGAFLGAQIGAAIALPGVLMKSVFVKIAEWFGAYDIATALDSIDLLSDVRSFFSKIGGFLGKMWGGIWDFITGGPTFNMITRMIYDFGVDIKKTFEILSLKVKSFLSGITNAAVAALEAAFTPGEDATDAFNRSFTSAMNVAKIDAADIEKKYAKQKALLDNDRKTADALEAALEAAEKVKKQKEKEAYERAKEEREKEKEVKAAPAPVVNVTNVTNGGSTSISVKNDIPSFSTQSLVTGGGLLAFR